MHIFYGSLDLLNSSTTTSNLDAHATLTGSYDYDYFGSTLSAVGDVNGDGYDDLAEASNFSSDLDHDVHLFHGSATRLSGSMEGRSVASVKIHSDLGGEFGSSLGGADINNDGHIDLYAAARYIDVGADRNVGTMYVFYGPSWGSRSASEADATFTGTEPDGYVGAGGHSMDANNDGIDDLIIGAYGASMAYLLFGGSGGGL